MCVESSLRNLHRFASGVETSPDLAASEATIWGDILRNANTEAARLGATPCCDGACPTVGTLLGVISYCYSKGVVSSADIERYLWSNPEFVATFGHRLPCALQLRNFRRRHRAAILSVIARAHRAFWKRESLRNADTQFACRQAEQLVEDACVTDSVEFD